MSDYYKTLGISKSATPEEIKRAYRKLAHQYHPDKKGGDEAKFKEANEAYQTLSDPQKKSQYDQFGSSGFSGEGGGAQGFGGRQSYQQGFDPNNFDFGSFGGFGDIFESMFGSGNDQAQQAETQRRGSDLEINLKIDFKEAAFGLTKQVRLRKKISCEHCDGSGAEPKTKLKQCSKCHGQKTIKQVRRTLLGQFVQESICPECQGKGEIPETPCKQCKGKGFITDIQSIEIGVPAGIENGTTLRLSGGGNASEQGGEPGDLFVNILVTPHPKFVRKDKDVYSKLLINFSEAALGNSIETETIHGKIKVKIPAGIQNGEKIRLRGKGVSAAGDHYLDVAIITPDKLSKEEKELFEELKKVEKKPEEDTDKNFFGNIFG